MEQELLARLDAQEKELAEIRKMMETVKKVFYWMLAITLALFFLPLLGLLFVIPRFLSTYSALGL
jgi:lipopolysaccharide/colanic/teichoic acid biosynthesis glycosyltransferase